MAKVLSYEALIKGGVTAQTKLVVPVMSADPVAPADGWVWVNTTDHALRYRENGATVTVGTSTLDTEAVIDAVAGALVAGNNVDITYNDTSGSITVDVESLSSADITDFVSAVRGAIAVADTATLDLSYTGGTLSGAVLDSPTVGGRSSTYLLSVDNHVDGTTNKVYTAVEKTKLAGVATGATANATNAFLLDRANHTGTQLAATISDFTATARGVVSATDTSTLDLTYTAATGVLSGTVLDSPSVGGRSSTYLLSVDNHVDGTVNKVFTAAEKTKLAGVATGATANATNAYLLDRTNHTGTQLASTISDLSSAVAGMSINAATLNGQTAAQLQTTITSAIVDSAPGTLDTLNELAAALGDDPNFATTITNGLSARSRFFAQALTGGTATEVVTHNLGTRRVLVQVFVNSGDYEEEEYIVRRTTANTITIVSEGQVIPAGREVVITAAA